MGRAAPGYSSLRDAALLTRNSVAGARPVSHLRMRRTIGQTGDGSVAAEPEIL
jgi:hypothetical protein